MMQRPQEPPDLSDASSEAVAEIAVAWAITLRAHQIDLEARHWESEGRTKALTNTFIKIRNAIQGNQPIE